MPKVTLIEGETVTRPDGSKAQRVVLVSSGNPLTDGVLNSGDVPGLNADDVIAPGSVLILEDKNYIAFDDNTFTEKT